MWKELILAGFALLMGAVFVTNGTLLVFRPDLFLRINDWINRGDYGFRTGSWRKDVYNPEWKSLGVLFIVTGLGAWIACFFLLRKALS